MTVSRLSLLHDSFRPRQGRAVRVGRVGRGDHERGRHLPPTAGVSRVRVVERPEPVNRAWYGELRRAESLDEIAAAGDSPLFQCGQHGVHRRETTG
jgi:hypothetical protein